MINPRRCLLIGVLFAAAWSLMAATPMTLLDFYSMDEQWTLRHNPYPSTSQRDPIESARRAFRFLKDLTFPARRD